jgi:CubicO group peptidase (beta-lactamase class C family)
MITPLMLPGEGHLPMERARPLSRRFGMPFGTVKRGVPKSKSFRNFNILCGLAGGFVGRSARAARWQVGVAALVILATLGAEAETARPVPAPVSPARPPVLDETPNAFTQVLEGWAKEHKVGTAVVVVRRHGRIVHRDGIGGGDPGARYHLASLSKAITGACIATLVRDRKLGFETPLAKALARFFAANGNPADARLERVTIAQLLTHRAGFSTSADGDDAATGSNLNAYLASHSHTEPPGPAYLTAVFATRLRRDPGSEYAYSNAGFLVLGAVIEEATSRPYADYCREAVLVPARAVGDLDPNWRVMGSYGGWRMSGADYLAFLDQFDPKEATFGTETRDWILDKTDKIYGKSSYPVWYGPGLRLRDAGRGIEMWHTGSWRRRLPPDARGPLSETSTFAMRIADGTSWFVHSKPLRLGQARAVLDQELLRAYQSVRHWE